MIFWAIYWKTPRVQRNPTVEISARNEGLKVLVEISDDGAGVPEQLLSMLAERGKRLDQTSGSAAELPVPC